MGIGLAALAGIRIMLPCLRCGGSRRVKPWQARRDRLTHRETACTGKLPG
jgi:hypothetical protein